MFIHYFQDTYRILLSDLLLSLPIVTDDSYARPRIAMMYHVDQHLCQPRAEHDRNTSIGGMMHVAITSITENLSHKTGDKGHKRCVSIS
jgi:hypothetical protein